MLLDAGRVRHVDDLNELREREQYTKPTTRRKLRKAAARARWRRQLADQELPPKLF